MRSAALVAPLAAFAFAAGLAGCSGDEPTAPPAIAGTYQLVDADGVPLPAPVFDDVVSLPDGDFHLLVTATAGELIVGSDGTYRQEVDVEVEIDGAPAPGQDWLDLGQYGRAGDEIVFTSDFIANLTYIGMVEGERIEIEQDVPGEGVDAVYGYERSP